MKADFAMRPERALNLRLQTSLLPAVTSRVETVIVVEDNLPPPLPPLPLPPPPLSPFIVSRVSSPYIVTTCAHLFRTTMGFAAQGSTYCKYSTSPTATAETATIVVRAQN